MILEVNKFLVFLFRIFFEKLVKFMMERLSTEQRTKVVQFYFKSQHSIIQTQRSYRHFFHVRNAPSAPTIYSFRQQGPVCDLPRAGRPRAV